MYIDDIKLPAAAESEKDTVAPVWTNKALSASVIKDSSADLSFIVPTDNGKVSKYEVLVNGNVTATVDFTDVEEKTFDLPGAKVNHEGQGLVY